MKNGRWPQKNENGRQPQVWGCPIELIKQQKPQK